MKRTIRTTDEALLHHLGSSITNLRLQKNLTQIEASAQAGVSKRTLERLESGHSIQLVGFLRTLRTLGLLEALTKLLPDPTVSPMARLQLQNQQRQRASKKKTTTEVPLKPWTWGDQP